MRIGIFTQWYEPEPGPASLSSITARVLVERGHEVHVLTGFPNYPSGKVKEGYRQQPRSRECLGGVNVLRVPLIPSHDKSALRRVANYASFGISAAMFGVTGLPSLDALWVNYSPVTLALPMWVQQVTRGTPTVCDVSDLWPDTIRVSGLDGAKALDGLGLRIVDQWCKAMYASSDLITYISPGVRDILISRGVPTERLQYLPKPADERIFHPGGTSLRRRLGIREDSVVVSYSGSMGAAQGLEALIEAFAAVDDPRLVLLMAGSGTQQDLLERNASRLNLPNIRFLGRLPQEQMTDLMATSDIAFASLARNPISSVTMPSKTQAAMACGRPVLAAASGDLARLITSNNLGFVAQPGDSASIAMALRAALNAGRPMLAKLGASARALYLAEFSLDHTTDLLESALSDVSQRRRGLWSRLAPTER